MHVIQFKHKVEANITYVVVPTAVPDMAQGWEEEMDDMVGIPLLVIEKGDDYVVLEHPYDGDCFSFGYKHIVLASGITKQVRLRNYKFRVYEELNPQAILGIVLMDDKVVLRDLKTADMRQSNIRITSELLEEIQEKCPRVIGAMLSHNLMEREI